MSGQKDYAALREGLAEYAHAAWSGWMKYLFEKCDNRGGDTLVIPAWAVERWQRQANTPYGDLPESEKESDRIEADRMIEIMDRAAPKGGNPLGAPQGAAGGIL